MVLGMITPELSGFAEFDQHDNVANTLQLGKRRREGFWGYPLRCARSSRCKRGTVGTVPGLPVRAGNVDFDAISGAPGGASERRQRPCRGYGEGEVQRWAWAAKGWVPIRVGER